MGIARPFSSFELKFLNKYYSSSNKLPLKDYNPKSNQKVKWKCPDCKHTEIKPVKEKLDWVRLRTNYNKSEIKRFCLNCIRIKFPYLPKNASSKRLRTFTARFNKDGSFKQNGKKHLLKEWDYEKNTIGPDRYHYSANYKVWWKCKYGHSFQNTIRNRHSHNGRCPKCYWFSTKTETRIFSELKLIDPKVEFRKKIDGFECDIFLKSSNIAIEIDGYPWHATKKKIAVDKKKSKHIKSLGITLLRFRERRCTRIHSTDTIYDERDAIADNIFKPFTRLLRKIKRLSKSNAVKKRVTKYLSENSCFINNDVYNDIYHNSANYGFNKIPADKLHKEFPKLWGSKNRLPMSHYPKLSCKKVWWKCPECKDEYKKTVKSMTVSWENRYKNGGLRNARKTNLCPIHRRGAKVNKFNNLVAVYGKWIFDVWDYKKNSKSPYKVKAATYNTEPVWIKCHVGCDSYLRDIGSLAALHRTYGKKDCLVLTCSKCHEKYYTKKSLNISKKQIEKIVSNRIKEIVASECKSSPISDLDLGKKLHKEGLFSLNSIQYRSRTKSSLSDHQLYLLGNGCRETAGIKAPTYRRFLSLYDRYGKRLSEFWDTKKNKQSIHDFNYYGDRHNYSKKDKNYKYKIIWLKCPNGCSSKHDSYNLLTYLDDSKSRNKSKTARGIRCSVCCSSFNVSKNIIKLEKNIIDIINNEFEPLNDNKIADILTKSNAVSGFSNANIQKDLVRDLRSDLGIPIYRERKKLFDKGEKIEYEYVQ